MNDISRIAVARIAWVDGRQVVHLPKGYHFDTTEVRITMDGNRIVLEEPEDGIDAETGLPMPELRRLIAEGMEGPDEPLDMAEIKRSARAAFDARTRG